MFITSTKVDKTQKTKRDGDGTAKDVCLRAHERVKERKECGARARAVTTCDDHSLPHRHAVIVHRAVYLIYT